jgi:hypothetical protein
MISEDSFVKILDFGLAKKRSRKSWRRGGISFLGSARKGRCGWHESSAI